MKNVCSTSRPVCQDAAVKKKKKKKKDGEHLIGRPEFARPDGGQNGGPASMVTTSVRANFVRAA